MQVVRITKTFTLELAHALTNHPGLCKNIHGHSYKLHVTVSGVPSSETGSEEEGMVIDFGNLKKIVNVRIMKEFDHSLVLQEEWKNKVDWNNLPGQRIVFLPVEPTCENLLLLFVQRLKESLIDHKLVAARLQETDTSWAEWHEQDN
jgi:6-pyruvoyltetrahydropterin/6-carboxytetrahydropterin synthase